MYRSIMHQVRWLMLLNAGRQQLTVAVCASAASKCLEWGDGGIRAGSVTEQLRQVWLQFIYA